MPAPVQSESDIRPGDFYEDCAYHPCLCIRVLDDEVSGVSLVDGSAPRCCSIRNCGLRRLTYDEAIDWRFYGPPDVVLEPGSRWWVKDADTARVYRPRRSIGPTST